MMKFSNSRQITYWNVRSESAISHIRFCPSVLHVTSPGLAGSAVIRSCSRQHQLLTLMRTACEAAENLWLIRLRAPLSVVYNARPVQRVSKTATRIYEVQVFKNWNFACNISRNSCTTKFPTTYMRSTLLTASISSLTSSISSRGAKRLENSRYSGILLLWETRRAIFSGCQEVRQINLEKLIKTLSSPNIFAGFAGSRLSAVHNCSKG